MDFGSQNRSTIREPKFTLDMLLYLLRHGDAVENPTLHDSERPLSDRGFEQARTAAQFFQRLHISFNLIIASPLLRAQQMAAPAREMPGVSHFLRSDYLLPGSNHQQLFDLLNAQEAGSVLLVGHEPHLSTTIALLTAGETTARIEMKKASCACVDIAKPLRKGQGTLKWLVTAEQMKLLQ